MVQTLFVDGPCVSTDLWNLYGFFRSMLIHIRVNVFTCGFDVFMSLVWPVSLPQALFVCAKKGVTGCLDYVLSGTCLKRRTTTNCAFWGY